MLYLRRYSLNTFGFTRACGTETDWGLKGKGKGKGKGGSGRGRGLLIVWYCHHRSMQEMPPCSLLLVEC